MYFYRFCIKSRQEHLSTSLFRTMQVQNEEKELKSFIDYEADFDSDYERDLDN